MAVTKKPFRAKVDKRTIDQIINRGGTSSCDQDNGFKNDQDNNLKNENVRVTIRLTTKMLDIIDQYLINCMSKKTRTAWVREAVEEKIIRDIQKGSIKE